MNDEEFVKKAIGIYNYMCDKAFIFSRDELIKFFEKYENLFKNGDNIIIRLSNNYDNEPDEDIDEDVDDEDIYEDELEDNDEEELEYDEKNIDIIALRTDDFDLINIVNENLFNFPDNEKFELGVPERIMEEYIADFFDNYVYSNQFGSSERNNLFELMVKYCKLLCDDVSLIPDSKEREAFQKFVTSCSLNEFIIKFYNDREFKKKVANIFDLAVFEEEIKKEEEYEDCNDDVLTINDIIRKKLSIMINVNLSNGVLNNDTIYLLILYLNGLISDEKFYSLYDGIFDDSLKLKDICNKKYIKQIMITDYIRFTELKLKWYDELDQFDYEYLDFMDKNDINSILDRFNTDVDFAFEVINSFIELNLHSSYKTRSECKNTKLIKKVNPYSFMDYKRANR